MAEETMTDGSFAISDELVIKQEPQDPIPEPMEEHHESQEIFPALTFPVVSSAVMQRAVSPPSCLLEPSEQKIRDLVLYYKEKYQLKDITIELERCDKIWETLQLIKNVQNSYYDKDDSCQSDLPNNLSQSQWESSDSLSYQPTPSSKSKTLPDFRYSVKDKRKLYYCVTCNKEFTNNELLWQHGISEHGIFVNPKRLYKVRTDSVLKDVEEIPKNNIKSGEIEKENEELAHMSVLESSQTEKSVKPIENIVDSSNSHIKPSKIKSTVAKEKIRCILCKRVCTDIVYHMKGYHKVGCISTIIAQCEKVKFDNNLGNDSSDVQTNKEVLPQFEELDMSEFKTTSLKKRKRNTTCWTIKKKYKAIDKNVKISQSGPFKCNICLGYYKNHKSFGYHKTLHKIRGETPNNFDPSKCRFLNSPLRNTKDHNSPEKVKNDSVLLEKKTVDLEKTNNFTSIQEETTNSLVQNDESMISDFNIEPDNDSQIQQTKCECGRSFRNYHTLYLHKVKCKGIEFKNDKLQFQNMNDTDSGIGISIKIKKNKNDSYEVVPNNISAEENHKDTRSSKDSDASSNDSGMVSVDSNNTKLDNAEVSKFVKCHSILRIQVAENDEDVDIEDGDSDKSSLHENDKEIFSKIKKENIKIVSSELLSKEESYGKILDSFKKSTSEKNNVPKLSNLCRQVLSGKKPNEELFNTENTFTEHASQINHDVKCDCPCGKKFKNFKYFNIHVRRFHPQLLKCSYCMTNFDRIEKYIEHKCEIKEGKLFIEPILQTQCTQCNALVDLGEQFDKHMRIHDSDSTVFRCFECKLDFHNFYQRKLHFNKEHRFTLCQVCGKLLNVDQISKHEAYHDGLGHPCHVCKKAFTQKIYLKKHIQSVHDPVVNKIVECFICSEKIKIRHLKKHISCHLHTEICKNCNKCCQSDEHKISKKHTASNKTDHLASKCNICDIPFLQTKSDEKYDQKTICEINANDTLIDEQNAIINR